jgi:hypothetical protein
MKSPPSEKLKQKRYCGLAPFKKGTSGNPSDKRLLQRLRMLPAGAGINRP